MKTPKEINGTSTNNGNTNSYFKFKQNFNTLAGGVALSFFALLVVYMVQKVNSNENKIWDIRTKNAVIDTKLTIIQESLKRIEKRQLNGHKSGK